MNERVFIGIGSNIGNLLLNCRTSIIKILQDKRVNFKAVSSLYLTSPVSDVAQDDFMNCVLSISWDESPEELLALLKSIEDSMGRKRSIIKGPRIIDLDILLFEDIILKTEALTIPHPELHKRKFAIIPCLDIDNSIVHPFYKIPLKEFLLRIGDRQKILLIKNRKEWEYFIFENKKERGNNHAGRRQT